MTERALFHDPIDDPCPARFNLAAYVLRHAATTPNKTALEIHGGGQVESWSFGQLGDAVLNAAAALKYRQLPAGAKILLQVGNTVEFPILYLAAISAGYVPVPCSTMLTAAEVDVLVADLQPQLIVQDQSAVHVKNLSCATATSHDLLATHNFPPVTFKLGDPNRLAYIVYTSGTSGIPRAVMHAHRAIWARRMMWSGWYDLRTDDRMLHAGAFNWTYTLGTGLFDPWAKGATALIAKGLVDRTQWPALIRQSSASIFAAAPGVLRQILGTNQDLFFPALRHALSAGEKLSASIQQNWQDRTKTPVFEAFGMSEISTFISANPQNPVAPEFIGYPQPGRKVAILSGHDAQPVPLDTPGVLAIDKDDAGLMLGYLNSEAETKAKFRGGWFLTGDVARMGKGGLITYLGRADDMMNAGGYRVSPLEVEAAVNSHAHISESAAVAVEIKADAYVIAVFYTETKPVKHAELTAHCAARLAKYKTPRLFIRLDALPKNPNGKVQRSTLKKHIPVPHDQT